MLTIEDTIDIMKDLPGWRMVEFRANGYLHLTRGDCNMYRDADGTWDLQVRQGDLYYDEIPDWQPTAQAAIQAGIEMITASMQVRVDALHSLTGVEL